MRRTRKARNLARDPRCTLSVAMRVRSRRRAPHSLKALGGRADSSSVRWKMLVGCGLIVLGALGLLPVLVHFQATSYGAGNLTGGILFVLVGVWLIRSDRAGLQS